jgi:hypothetical protein
MKTTARSPGLATRDLVEEIVRSLAGAILLIGFPALSLGVVSPAAASYTPAMAKRLAPGPFDAAPIVQGGWADGAPSDTLVFARGTQVSGTFYQTLDASQGSLVVWITPEWAGSDGARHDFFDNDSGADPGAISLRAQAGSLVFRVGGSSAEEVSVSIAAWVAGARHCIVARWDNDNGLSGANRLGLSIDDVHTFATQTTPPAAIGAQNYVGSDRSGLHPANAIIEGLTIYRRPLFDGTYGIDVGNGDEINLIYNGGSGKDPASVTGSWDVVFAMPTNSAVGALATGTGQAWTHPYLSNAIPGNSNRGGLMLAGAAATDGWSNEGTPTSVLPLATAEKIFAGGYRVASNAANQGIRQDVTVAPGDDGVLRAIVHSDGTCLPRLILYNQTGGAEIGHVDGTTTSTRTAPNVLMLAGEAPTGSTTLRLKLVNAAAAGTCYWHQAEGFGNYVDNPSMERWQATTPLIPSAWVNEAMEAGAPTQEAAIVHSGTYSFRFQGGPDTDRADYSLGVGANGDFYTIGAFGYWVNGQASFEFLGGTSAWLTQYSAATDYSLAVQNDVNTWKHRVGVARRVAGGDATAYVGQYNSAGNFIIDDFYAFPLTPVSLTATPASAANSVENGELRVDGRDVSLQAGVAGLGTTSGTYTVAWRPRHSAGSGVAFAEGTATQGAYILSLHGGANDYIDVYWDQNSRIRMSYRMAGTNGAGTWSPTGAQIVAGTKYTVEVAYTGGGSMTLKIDGTTRITLNPIPGAFGTAPANVYRGSRSNGDRQGDATFANAATVVSLVFFAATPLDSSVGLGWETGSELDNLGFHLYRAPSADGPWIRLNASLIPGLGSSPEGRQYRWVDSGLANGTTYFYRLEDMDRHGVVTSHGPVAATPLAGVPEPGEGEGPTEPSPPPQEPPKAAPERKAHGDPAQQSLRVLERSASGVTLELVTGGFYSEEQEDGASKLIVPGFFDHAEPGRPTVPTRRLWADAVVGRGVVLVSVEPSDLVVFPDLSVSLTGRPVAVTTREGTYEAAWIPVKPGARSARDATRSGQMATSAAADPSGLFPASQAFVHQTAFQGERKKAYVELAPLQVDEASGDVTLARRLVVRLAFSGRVEGETGRGNVGRSNPLVADAAGARVLARLATRSRGLHAIAFEQIPGLSAPVVPSALRLSRLGSPVAFHLEPHRRPFGPGSVLFFLADDPDSAYGNEAVYELAIAPGGIQMGGVLPTRRSSPFISLSLSLLRHEDSFETDAVYLPALLEARDLWMWDLGLPGGQAASYSFTLDSPVLVPDSARLCVELQGGSDTETDPDHHVIAFLNGSLVGEIRFDGMVPATLSVDVPSSLLLVGENTLRLENAGDTGSIASHVYLDRFSLEVPRGISPLAGVLEGRADQSGRVSLAAAPGALLLDVTAPVPRFLARAAADGRLRWNAETDHRYLAVSPEAFLAPELRPAPAATLHNPENQADWIVIAPEAFLPAVEPLVSLRQGQGLAALAVSLEAVVDEFGYGEAGPHALQRFLAFAFHEWTAPAPRYVLLLGEASYDPKERLAGTSRPDLIPSPLTKSTFLWTPADPLYAAVNGVDSLPDIAIGRINAATLQEAQAAVQKILDFETSGQTLAGKATLVADNPDTAGDFEANQDEIATLLPSRVVEKLYLTQLGATATKAAVRTAFDSGLSLMSYVGHGSSGLWASEGLLRSPDVASFAPQAAQPLVLSMTCSNGYFLSPYSNSLAERLVLAEGKGAIAAFAPSGLSLNDAAHVYHRAIVSELELGNHPRLGDLLLAAQASYAATGAFPELLQIYNLLGDPGTRIR